MAKKIATMERLRWVHINPITEEDIGFLNKEFKFHHLDLSDCRQGSQRPKMDVYRHYLFMILHFPTFNNDRRRVGIKSLNVFVGRNYLVTMTNDSIALLDEYFSKTEKKIIDSRNKSPLQGNSSFLLYKLIDILYRKTLPVINELGQYLNNTEEEVFSGQNKEATRDLAVVRRNVLNMRRILEPQLKMMDRLVNMKTVVYSEKLSVYYDDVHDYMENMWAILGTFQDTINGLYSTNESMVNQKTNEVIKMLTLISVALLPLTLIASIYGMNVEGLPFADHPIGLWIIFVLMASIVWAAIYIARKNKFI